MSFSEIFYKVRCEYAHEGNYTGKIFKDRKKEDKFIFGFKCDGKDISGECNLTYKEFIDIQAAARIFHGRSIHTHEAAASQQSGEH